ncbi:PI-PLC X domain-containing protein 3-like isoform X3 [Anthonomus grandis grandis]|uniref:PI-PLC X domain-containing protein 3-like isoform X3 n=1 Tax=Anthonomus grandis grandis TaxID=2921223 RepID=UPI0021664536|nr:PI-PLC X domain-containing protein 3-like isoform X3 [Anthonomus grandis grandis]
MYFISTSSPDEYSTKVDRMIGENMDLTRDLEFWMSKLPACLRALPIIYLSIPGSHNSFTSNISGGSIVSLDSPKILQNLEWIYCIRHIMANWTKNQNVAVKEQLKAGIRYFDLRVSAKSRENNLYFCHGMYSCKVEPVLNEISTFLETHSKEVITVYRSDAARFGQPLFWPSASFPTPWANTIDHNALFNFLDDKIKDRKDNVGFITQIVLTPTLTDILFNSCTTLEQKLAIDFEDLRTGWISKQTPGRRGVNIVIGDFIDLSDNLFTKTVINLNLKLLRDLPKRMTSPIN